MKSLWLRLWCKLGFCMCVPYEDENGIGGKCINCGQIFGYMTNGELRAFAERDILHRLERRLK